MIHLTETDLHRLYKSETGNSCADWNEDNEVCLTNEYLLWLEQKLLFHLNQEIKDKEIMNKFNSEMQQIKVEEM